MTSPSRRLLRADLHVHTRHSRLEALPFLSARDCYSSPREAYLRAKARGMDLVTFTDHDTIDGCLELLSREGELADFFISEEVSVKDRGTGSRLHISVYGIDERIHREIQRLRGDLRELLAYLEQEGIAAALNHIGSSLVGERLPGRALLEMARAFPLLETRNGAQGEASNRLASVLAERLEEAGMPIGTTGGSDAHTPRRIGSVWTEARAEDRSSFLESLRARRVSPRGSSAHLTVMLTDVYQIVFAYYGDVVANRNGHFTHAQRRKAIVCAALSLPLQLVALPALGTILRRLRVRAAAHRHGRRMNGAVPDEVMGAGLGTKPEERPRPARAGGSVMPAAGWVPRPGSEEA